MFPESDLFISHPELFQLYQEIQQILDITIIPHGTVVNTI